MATIAVGEPYPGPGPSPLVCLPFEVWSRISIFICRETAFAASTASRHLRGAVFHRLFEKIHTRIHVNDIALKSHHFLLQEPANGMFIPRHYVKQLRITYSALSIPEPGGLLLANFVSYTVSRLPRLQSLHVDIQCWDIDDTEAALFTTALVNCPQFNVKLLELHARHDTAVAFIKQCTGLQVLGRCSVPDTYDWPTEPVLHALMEYQPGLRGIHLERALPSRVGLKATLHSVVHEFHSLEVLILDYLWWVPWLIHELNNDIDFSKFLEILCGTLEEAKNLTKFLFNITELEMKHLPLAEDLDDSRNSLEPALPVNLDKEVGLWAMSVIRKVRRHLPHTEHIGLNIEDFYLSSSITTSDSIEVWSTGWELGCADMLADVTSNPAP